MNKILFGLIILFIISCSREPDSFGSLPSEVLLGESVVYLNGEAANNMIHDFKYIEVNKIMNYAFYDSTATRINILGFSWLPLSTGEFDLHDDRILYVKAFTSFTQVVAEDLEGYSYKLVDADQGYLNIDYLDTVEHIVKGRFWAEFKRTSKNGNGDLGLPKRLLLQGIFHEKYLIY